ncbi:domain of Kin17 curved DNA-binding protein-domain-containing protein [Gamsiella multidivaricata]|uniref:domain of Kin17 curved DNA-binding protein-domain-containing protein n=1 Tax=Gamsiella multidivaricata TaxID=101098 RepID=UPI00221F81EC|nr:domain of Kin17 curved DNA-binding protein-domain-containing protein [Gamsiella multidivaricata]KAI7816365.1 domain of Kin17 curved DNA-binding protein-domain-containing protein [Gamsiella multidivaricata]
MAKDGFLTAKAVANRIKSKGLQKLRWYCQICEKQCRDENGFKCHCASESHQRKILLVAESPEKYVNDYSGEFQKDFLKLLSTRYGTRRVHANLVYQEFISDRTHLHMNATKWASLSEFAMHLGKEGLATVDETPKGWFIQWVDNSPKNLARQEAIAKKERMEMDDEQREQKLIQQQIERAAALRQQQQAEDGGETAKELVRENDEEKIKLDIAIKPAVGLGGGLRLGAGAGLLKPKSLNALATKKPNPFSSKSSSSAASTAVTPSSTTTLATPTPAPASVPITSAPKKRSAVEEIIEQEMARKKRLAERSSESGHDHRSSRDFKDDRDHRLSRDSRDDRDRDRDRDRDHRASRDSRDDRDDRDYRSSRDSRDDRDRDYRSSRDSRDRDSYRDRDRDRERERDRDRY